MDNISDSHVSFLARAFSVLRTQLSVQLLVGTVIVAFVSQFFLGVGVSNSNLNSISQYIFDLPYFAGYFLLIKDSQKRGFKSLPFYLLLVLQICYLLNRSFALLISPLPDNYLSYSLIVGLFSVIIYLLIFIISGKLITSRNKNLKIGGIFFLLRAIVVIASSFAMSIFVQKYFLQSDILSVDERIAIVDYYNRISSIPSVLLLICSYISIGIGIYEGDLNKKES